MTNQPIRGSSVPRYSGWNRPLNQVAAIRQMSPKK